MTTDKDSRYLYFLSFSKGRGGVYRVGLDDPGSAEPVVLHDDICGFALALSGDIVYTSASLC